MTTQVALKQLRDRASGAWAHARDPQVEEVAAVLCDLLDLLIDQDKETDGPADDWIERLDGWPL